VIEPINSDSTEKLQELLETIASGINKTEEILARSQQVEVEVSQHRDAILKDTKLVSQLTLHTERKAYEVVGVQADIEQIANVVGSTVGELGGLDALEALQKEHKSLLITLEEIKAESQKFQQLQAEARHVDEKLTLIEERFKLIEDTKAENPQMQQFQVEARHVDEKLTLIQERFEAVNSMISNAQAELVQRALSMSNVSNVDLSSNDRNDSDRPEFTQIIARATEDLRQEQQVADNEHRQKIRALERKQQSLISLIIGGVGVAVVLLIVILVIIVKGR
jgi:hypothetical protein